MKDTQPKTLVVILLSGGLDSVAAAVWRLSHKAPDETMVGLGFAYGQCHADAELSAAGRIAKDLGLPYSVIHLAGAVSGEVPITAPRAGTTRAGVSSASLPCRNAIFLIAAAAWAARHWYLDLLEIVIGCNADDAKAFPDCRGPFLDAAAEVLRASLVGVCPRVHVVRPWEVLRKDAIVRWAIDNDALDTIRRSVSCYAGTRCGTCDACTLRALAFFKSGVPDSNKPLPPMTGGDPSRMPR